MRLRASAKILLYWGKRTSQGPGVGVGDERKLASRENNESGGGEGDEKV